MDETEAAKAVINGEAMLGEIRMDLPRLRRYREELERNIGVLEKAVKDETAKADHVDHMIEVLEAKEIQMERRVDAYRVKQEEAVERGGQD